MNCQICGNKDLFSAVTFEGVCAVCKMKFIGGLTATTTRIKEIRQALGLKDGEYLKQNIGEEAARILGRR